nr:type IV toxin-antitoxin system AbiEi family antitoxin domain-containing protein [Micromonospora inaquosa]
MINPALVTCYPQGWRGCPQGGVSGFGLGQGGWVDALDVVRRVAAVRDGVVTLRQARAAGLTAHEVQRLCRAGRWRVVARGTYLVDADLYDGVPRAARIRAAVASFRASRSRCARNGCRTARAGRSAVH